MTSVRADHFSGALCAVRFVVLQEGTALIAFRYVLARIGARRLAPLRGASFPYGLYVPVPCRCVASFVSGAALLTGTSTQVFAPRFRYASVFQVRCALQVRA